MYTNNTIKDFFYNAFDVQLKKMVIGKEIDVKKFNVFVKSYSHKLKIQQPKRVLKIVRKKDEIGYKITLNKSYFLCSKDHKILIKFFPNKEATYLSIKDILNSKPKVYFALNNNNNWVKIIIEKTNNKILIYDFEVEENHNYYTNNILSHNTVYGNPEVTTGGNALKFYASIRLDIRSSIKIEKKEEIIGNIVKIKAAKNKTSPPFRIAEVKLFYGKGYSKEADILDICINKGIIKKSGSWFSYGEIKLGQGENNVIELLEDNQELIKELKIEIENVEN